MYGSLMNKFLELEESSELKEVDSYEEFVSIMIDQLSLLEEDIEVLEDEEDIVEEGANIDYISELNKIKSTIRAKKIDMKKYAKTKDKSKFIKTCDEAIDALDDAKNAINKIEPTLGSTVISVALKLAKAIGMFYLAVHGGAALMVKGHGVAGYVVSAGGGGLSGLTAPLPKPGKGVSNVKMWNQYRKNALQYIELTKEDIKAQKANAKTW